MSGVAVSPGDVLWEEFMVPLGLECGVLAGQLGVSYGRLDDLLSGVGAVTPDLAVRLGERFGTSARLWLGLEEDWRG